jgi:hypothetical protein
MDDQPERLVDHDDVVVAIEDLERDVLRFQTGGGSSGLARTTRSPGRRIAPGFLGTSLTNARPSSAAFPAWGA